MTFFIFSGGDIEALFVPVPASESGIDWEHENAMSESRYLPETMGGGGAFLDYDGDGWLDIYLVNSGPSDFFVPSEPVHNALYRNNGDGTFSEVTMAAGVSGNTFGMGAAVGDYDNDGDPDLYVTAYGPTILYRNNGDGTFSDVTREANVRIDGWTTSAAWFDYDADGLLDLFVCSFVEFGVDKHISCGLNPLGKTYYCVPRVFDATSSILYRNRGNGTFEKVSDGTAIASNPGKALGVVAADINNDRLLDLFVANDTVQDFLFVNRGGNRWDEVGLFSGVGLSTEGKAQSGMGVDAADINGDGLQELFVANIDHQDYSLFENQGSESFLDVSRSQGIAEATFLFSGFGLRFFDYDNDADPDLMIANGHPDDMISQYSPNVSYREPPQLFENRNGKLVDVSARSGPIFGQQMSGRGLATGDFNNDGRVDVLIVNNGEPPVLLQNQSSENHWIGLRLQGREASRDAIGATIRWSAEGKAFSHSLNGGSSYLSAHDLRVVLGMGKTDRVDWLEIHWPAPSQRVDRFEDLEANRYLLVTEGESPRPLPIQEIGVRR